VKSTALHTIGITGTSPVMTRERMMSVLIGYRASRML
jgi:hypothetical protein